jgi:hypothetical protein
MGLEKNHPAQPVAQYSGRDPGWVGEEKVDGLAPGWPGAELAVPRLWELAVE